MSHAITRNVPAVPRAGGGTAGSLTLAEVTCTEWDILMTRQDRWITCRSGITDPEEVVQELGWFVASNPRRR